MDSILADTNFDPVNLLEKTQLPVCSQQRLPLSPSPHLLLIFSLIILSGLLTNSVNLFILSKPRIRSHCICLLFLAIALADQLLLIHAMFMDIVIPIAVNIDRLRLAREMHAHLTRWLNGPHAIAEFCGIYLTVSAASQCIFPTVSKQVTRISLILVFSHSLCFTLGEWFRFKLVSCQTVNLNQTLVVGEGSLYHNKAYTILINLLVMYLLPSGLFFIIAVWTCHLNARKHSANRFGTEEIFVENEENYNFNNCCNNNNNNNDNEEKCNRQKKALLKLKRYTVFTLALLFVGSHGLRFLVSALDEIDPSFKYGLFGGHRCYWKYWRRVPDLLVLSYSAIKLDVYVPLFIYIKRQKHKQQQQQKQQNHQMNHRVKTDEVRKHSEDIEFLTQKRSPVSSTESDDCSSQERKTIANMEEVLFDPEMKSLLEMNEIELEKRLFNVISLENDQQHNTVILILATIEQLRFLHNLIASLTLTARERDHLKFVIMCLDMDIFSELFNIRLINKAVLVPKSWLVGYDGTNASDRKSIMTGHYSFAARIHILYKLMQRLNYSWIVVDSNTIFLNGHIMDYLSLEAKRCDFSYSVPDVSSNRLVHSNFWHLKSTNFTKFLFKKWSQTLNEIGWQNLTVAFSQGVEEVFAMSSKLICPLNPVLFASSQRMFNEKLNRKFNIKPLIVHSDRVNQSVLQNACLWFTDGY